MSQPLFREEAVAQQLDRLHGDVLLLPSVRISVVAGFLIFIVTAAVILLFTMSYSRKETVVGWLEPNEGVVRIYPEGEGIIAETLVANGDFVEKGQPLVKISNELTMADGVGLDERMMEEYIKQREYFTEQLESTENLAGLRITEQAREVDAHKADLEFLNQEVSILEKRKHLQSMRVERSRRMLDKGHLSQTEYHTVVEQHLALESELKRLQREKNAKQTSLDQLLVEKNRMAEEYRIQASTIKSQISELSQKINSSERNREYVITADRNGIVSNLQAERGLRVSQSHPLLSLLPEDGKLRITLIAPVRASGFINPEQAIRIKYDAFPFQKFGAYEAVVDHISRSVVLPNELQSAPVPFNEPVYVISAHLKDDNVVAYGGHVPLKAGMTLSADITLEDRTLMEWIFEPILSLRGGL